MTILHSSKEQKQKLECLPSAFLNLLTLQLQSLKSDRGTRLVFSNCFVVFTVNFPENPSGTNSAVSSVRGASTEENSARSGSDQTAFGLQTEEQQYVFQCIR